MKNWKRVYSILSQWGFGIAFFTFSGIVFTVYHTIGSFQEHSHWTDHTYEVLDVINQIEVYMERAENAQRSYFLARDTNLLQIRNEALTLLPPEIKKLRGLVVDNALQTSRAEDLENLVHNKIINMDALLKEADHLTPNEIGKRIDLKSQPIIVERIRQLEKEEQELLALRRIKVEETSRSSMQLILLGAIFTFGVLLINRRALYNSSMRHRNQSLLLNSIFDSMSNGLMVVDGQGGVSMFNKVAEELIGIPPMGSDPQTRIKAGGLINLQTGQPLKPEESALARALKGNTVKGLEVLSSLPGRTPYVLNVDASPILDGDGRVNGALALFQDITERKSLEKEWEKARETAVEASRLKSNFLAAMSHEIRTPMNGVVGMTTLLLDTTLSNDQKSYVKTIKSSADSLLTLINQILDHSKIESGKLELDIADFNLPETLESVFNMFRYLARSKNIGLELSVDPSLPEVMRGDATRVKQIIINLVGNALKFTEKGFVRVTATAAVGSEGKQKILFEVKDSGPGIPKAKQSALFERFSQVHTGGHAKYGGTGLGLMISKELAKLMNGEMGVESVEGFGSRFWFSAEFAPAEKIVHSAMNTEHKRETYRGHVLVAEDQPVNQSVIEKFLQIFGLTCQIAPNGAEAVKAYKAGKFDMVLMDCQMPIMDGYEATTQIRAYQKEVGMEVPVVALTAEGYSGDRNRCFQVGMTDFLVKPLDIDLLAKVLREHLNKGSAVFAYDIGHLEKLDALKNDGVPLSITLIREFLKNSPETLQQIQTAYNKKDLKAIEEGARTLRTSCMTLGLLELGKLCEDLEEDPRRQIFVAIETSWKSGCQWLSDFEAKKSSRVA